MIYYFYINNFWDWAKIYPYHTHLFTISFIRLLGYFVPHSENVIDYLEYIANISENNKLL